MSLDQNLFTLNFNPNKDDPTVTDLVDGAGVVHYHKQRVSDAVEYRMNVYGSRDPVWRSHLWLMHSMSCKIPSLRHFSHLRLRQRRRARRRRSSCTIRTA
jgi:hypothetical protein